MMRWMVLACALGAAGAVGGCSSEGRSVPVSGTVELNGKPLADGTITLVGDGGAVPETLDVKDGKFDGQAKPGKKRVEIRANRPGKATKMGDTVIPASPENFLPDKYNTASTLTAEVTATGLAPNKFTVTYP